MDIIICLITDSTLSEHESGHSYVCKISPKLELKYNYRFIRVRPTIQAAYSNTEYFSQLSGGKVNTIWYKCDVGKWPKKAEVTIYST